MTKSQMVFEIVRLLSSMPGEVLYGQGVLEVLPDGFGFLRWALRGNALFSAISGIALAIGAFWLGPRLGVQPSWILAIVGLGLIPFAVDLFFNSSRTVVDIRRAKLAIAGDAAWIVGSIAVLLIDPTGLTTAGTIAVIAVAVLVADFAVAQTLGVRRATTGQTA